jgi:hypothetical protein
MPASSTIPKNSGFETKLAPERRYHRSDEREE